MPRMLGAAILLGVTNLLAGRTARIDPPPYIYTSTPRYDAAAWNQGHDRFPAGAHLVLVSRDKRRNVAPEFFASADAVVSYDGKRILFAARQSKQDPWQIWQLDLAQGKPQRMLSNSDDCIRPLYLPAEKIAYTRVTASGSTIEVIPLAGGKMDLLTHAPGRYLTSDVLADGRILFESRGDIFTVYPDGTGVETLRCDHGPQRSGARQISSGDVIFSVRGALARFTSPLAVQETLPPAKLEMIGPVSEPSAAQWLVSARPRSGGLFAIYQTGPAGRDAELLESPRAANAVEPVVLASHVPPREFPSGLLPTRKTSNLLCLNAADSKDPIPGKIHSVRLYTRGATGDPNVLGQTGVASDGSFYVEVPSNQPIRIELLDETGKQLRSEEHWFWMRPSEQRVCVGCHAGPERAPDNRVPEILNQIQHPVKMLP